MAMDVDAAQKIQQLPLKDYYHCGEANYLVKDCSYC